MMKNYDVSVEINHKTKCSYVPDHPYRILIIEVSESNKTNVLVNVIKHQWSDIEKNYFCTKYPFGIKKLRNP